MNNNTTPIRFILLVILFFGVAEVFAAEGDLDPTFDGDGIVATDNGSNSEEVRDIAVQPDAKIIALGYSPIESTSTNRAVIVRYNANGSIDSTFGTSGKVIIEQLVNPQALALQADGKIVIVGSIGFFPNNNFYASRLNADGSFDTTFNGTGTVILDFGFADVAQSVKIQPDGKIVIGGQSGNGITNGYVIVRFNAYGSLDTTFDGDGIASTRVAPFSSEVESFADLIIQPDGKIVGVGAAGVRNSNGLLVNSFVTVRFNADGSLDTTFDGDGRVITQTREDLRSVKSVALQSGGKIIVGGTSLVRYNPDGSIDSSFGTDGKILTPAGSDIEVQSDDKIVLALKNGGVARFNADGSPDLTFSGDGQNIIQVPSGSTAAANASAIQPGGKIVIGGYIGPSNARDFLLARFEAFSCTYSLSPSSLSTSSAGGTFNFTVTTQQGCSDVVKSNDPFITINTRTIGENSDVIFLSINYSVSANTGAARTGTINIGNQNFAVIQAIVKSRKRVRFF